MSMNKLKEIDLFECKGIDEFKEAEGGDIRVLLLTVMKHLHLINGEQVREEEQQAAALITHNSAVNYFKTEIKKMMGKAEE